MTAPERMYMKPNDMYENGWSRPIDTDQFDEEATEYVRADIAAVPEQDECGHPFCGAKCGTGPVIAIEPQPDPRDEVIARLMEALDRIGRGPEDAGCFCGACVQVRSARTALAAAKAVQK